MDISMKIKTALSQEMAGRRNEGNKKLGKAFQASYNSITLNKKGEITHVAENTQQYVAICFRCSHLDGGSRERGRVRCCQNTLCSQTGEPLAL